MFFEKKCAVERLTPTAADADKEQYATISAYRNIDINIQPATAELTAVSDGIYGQTFQAFVTVSGIRTGDRVTVSGTNDLFIVKGVHNWNYGPIPHYEIVLFKGDN